MSFPTTPILDDFNRGDTGPKIPSSCWAQTAFDTANDGLKVSSNVAITNTLAVNNDSYWRLTNYGPDCEAYCDLVAKNTVAGSYFFFGLRLNVPATIGSRSGYVILFGNPADNQAQVYRLDGASTPAVGSPITVTITAGDSYGVSMVGSTITVWRKPAGGSWTSQGTATDTTYKGAGFISLGALDNTAHSYKLDNFGGGTVGQDAFPTSIGLLDNFNRADEAPLAPPWAKMSQASDGWGTFALTGSMVSPMTGGTLATYYKPYIFPANCELYITSVDVVRDNGNTPTFSLGARFQNPELHTLKGYEVVFAGSGSSNNVPLLQIFRVDDAATTVTITGINGPIYEPGTKLGLRISGSEITAYVNNGNFWYLAARVQDSTYPSGGYVELGGFNINGKRFDDFFAGNYPGVTPFPQQAAVYGT